MAEKVTHLRYWVQKVLPLVYDDSLSYYELLNKVVKKLNETIDIANITQERITEEVERLLTEWYEDGTLEEIIGTTLDDISGRMTQVEEDFSDLSTSVESDIGDIQEDVTEIQGDITDINNRIDNLSGDVSDDVEALENSISSVSDDVTALSGRVTTLEYMYSLIPGKNIVFIGDSLTVGSGATNPATERFSYIVCKKLGMVEKNFGVGASGFTRPHTFIEQLNTANNNMTAEEKANTTAVLICGGANDFRWASETTRATFLENVNSTFIYARSIFPNAVIYSAIANGILDTYSDTDRYWADLANDNLMKMSDYGRIFVIKNVADSVNGRKEYFQGDGLHLTTEGHAYFGGFICNAMMGGSTNTEYYVGTYSFDSDYISSTPTIPHVFRYNNFILFGQGRITLAQAISSNTLVGTYSGPYEYSNIYMDIFQGNERVGSFGLGETGAVRIIPNSGVTLASGSTITLRDYVGVFRKYIG